MINPLFALVLMTLTYAAASFGETPKYTLQPAKVTPQIADTEEIRAFKEILAKAKAGDAKAQFYVGSVYFQGAEKSKGVKKDEAEAESWFLKAAKQGDRNAFIRLRLIHFSRARALKQKGMNDTEELTNAFMYSVLLGQSGWSPNNGVVTEATIDEAKRRASQFKIDNGIVDQPTPGR
jgi:TPR repeat protein